MDGPPPPPPPPSTWIPAKLFLYLLAFPVILSFLAYQTIDFDAAELPEEYFVDAQPISVPLHHGHILDVMERVGDGKLPGPEDFAYEPSTGFLYTGCADGWIKRVNVLGGAAAPAQVQEWAFVGGHPLGVAFSPDYRRLYVANPHKGLMAVDNDGTATVLANEADGLRFALADGVDVAADGVVYFTDASHKYGLEASMMDVLEGRPYGRLLSFNPVTNQTQVLLRDLYFANGVAVSPTQDFLIFCETPLRRCRRYHIRGAKKGSVDGFVSNLPGYPDNVRYDGEQSYWIATSSGKTAFMEMAFRYPFIRRMLAFTEKRFASTFLFKDGGVLEVRLDGKPMSLRKDPRLHLLTSGIKVGEHLYLGFLTKSHVGRIDLGARG